MSTTWEDAIQRTIASLNGEAQLKLIYEHIEQFISLSEYQKRETEWGSRPAYHHTIRSVISNLCDKGVLEKKGRGTYAIVPDEINAQLMDTIIEDIEAFFQEETYVEGKQSERYVNYYERNPKLRAKAIILHGLKCMVCGFDFEDKYGNYGKNYIEVHHVKPLSSLKADILINPETDMAVVCSNCHRMIHRRKDNVLSLEELKQIIKSHNE